MSNELDQRVMALEDNYDMSVTRTASKKYPWQINYRDRTGEYREIAGDAAFVLGSLKFDRIIADHC